MEIFYEMLQRRINEDQWVSGAGWRNRIDLLIFEK